MKKIFILLSSLGIVAHYSIQAMEEQKQIVESTERYAPEQQRAETALRLFVEEHAEKRVNQIFAERLDPVIAELQTGIQQAQTNTHKLRKELQEIAEQQLRLTKKIEHMIENMMLEVIKIKERIPEDFSYALIHFAVKNAISAAREPRPGLSEAHIHITGR